MPTSTNVPSNFKMVLDLSEHGSAVEDIASIDSSVNEAVNEAVVERVEAMEVLGAVSGAVSLFINIAQVANCMKQLYDDCRHLKSHSESLKHAVTGLLLILEQLEQFRCSDYPTIQSAIDELAADLYHLGTLVLRIDISSSKWKVFKRLRLLSRARSTVPDLHARVFQQMDHINFLMSMQTAEDASHIRAVLVGIHEAVSIEPERFEAIERIAVQNLAELRDLDHKIGLIGETISRLDQLTNIERDVAICPLESTSTRPNAIVRGQRRLASRIPPDCGVYRQTKCKCRCHSLSRMSFPSSWSTILGRCFANMSGAFLTPPPCDNHRCYGQKGVYLDAEYWCPPGMFWSGIIQFRLSYQWSLGPTLQLNTIRRIPDDAPAITFALGGDLEGLKDLFVRGLASPWDVSETRGYSLLRWALYDKHFNVVEFLCHLDADPEYAPPTAQNDCLYNSPRNRAHAMMLQHELSPSEEQIARLLIRNSDFLVDQEFTTLHEIILELRRVEDVETAIKSHIHDIETPDRAGRTPLAWAAAQGNAELVAILLRHGARHDTVEGHGTTPLYNACHSNKDGSDACCRLLLAAGASPDPERPEGMKAMSPLIVACAENPALVPTLIEFNANVDSTGGDGRTALHHAARRGSTELVKILLNAGACTHIESVNKETALTTATTYNRHEIIEMLIRRRGTRCECAGASEAKLLSIVAQYADIHTINLLAETQYEIHLDKGHRAEHSRCLRNRSDFNDDLECAFDRLVKLVERRALSEVNPDRTFYRASTLGIDTTCKEKIYDQTDMESCGHWVF